MAILPRGNRGWPSERGGGADWGRPGSPSYHGRVPTEELEESAAPPQLARIIAFLAILAAGATGGFIGYAVTDLQCHNDCSDAVPGLGGLVGAVIAAVGVAVVAMLALRAMAEWRTIQETGDAGNWRDEKALAKEKATRPSAAPSEARPRPRVR